MANIINLSKTIKAKAYDLGIGKQSIDSYITSNIKHDFFSWQIKAMENFLTYQAVQEKKGQINSPSPTHLMFNMAIGTGKTLLMAATILYYYKQGYRYFMFFVNQNNIIDKTENNFINSTHNKYLFKEKLVIDDKTITIKKVENFSDFPIGIEIKFTTIQKLYNDIHLEKENQTSLADLIKKDIVMLADEAHHLNTDTKKTPQQELFLSELSGKSSSADIEKKGWEHTVIDLILHKNSKQLIANKNCLLEFSATIPHNEQVAKKYQDKIIYQFGLKEFLSAGYTKEINLISSTLDKKERILQALLFQWYRHKIALKYDIINFKPVILFRSKTIAESRADYQQFLDWMANISSDDFDFLTTIADKIFKEKTPQLFTMGLSRTEQVLNFIKQNNINYNEVTNFINHNFKDKNVIITNSSTNKTQKEKTDANAEKLLNSLEDKNNHIRAIFTVDRLTEGWDVLNLFDIVRLYQGQNAGGSNKKTPEATTKEKQLIGRGVRYFPFTYKDKIANKRKFDNDINHELRVLEELYYYTYDEKSRYIAHLKEELKKDGFIRDDRIYKTFALKEEFKNSDFYQKTKLWYNKPIINPNRRKKTLEHLLKDWVFSYRIQSLEFKEQQVDFEQEQDIEKLNLSEEKLKTIQHQFKAIEKHIFLKAINIKAKQENSLFQFKNLKTELILTSIDDLQKEQFLGNFNLDIIVDKNIEYEDISSKDKLTITLKFLTTVFEQLKDSIIPKIGSEFIAGNFKQFFAREKTKSINENNLNNEIVKGCDWYVLDNFVGTQEELELVEFIKSSIGNLEQQYQEIYLLKNEEVYKIYDFAEGRGFMPDFLLLLKSNKDNLLYYQVFIEPKGEHLIEHDQWKEEFLQEIADKYGDNKIIQCENKNYKLIGLPFFNKNNTSVDKYFKEQYSINLY